MAKITLHGNEIHTNGNLPNIGSAAPDFTLVNKDLENVSLSAFPGKRKILNIVPSLDTPVCAMSAKKFNDYAKEHEDTAILVISADLPCMSAILCFENLEHLTRPLLSIIALTGILQRIRVDEDGPTRGLTHEQLV